MARRPPKFGGVESGGGAYVTGVKELRWALKRADADLNRELTAAMKEAARPIADDAKRRLRASIKNPGRSSGKAESSIRLLASGRHVTIKGGRKAVPYYGWLDFGGSLRPTGGRSNYQYRPKIRQGRYIYPAVAKNKKKVIKRLDRAVEKVIRKAGLY